MYDVPTSRAAIRNPDICPGPIPTTLAPIIDPTYDLRRRVHCSRIARTRHPRGYRAVRCSDRGYRCIIEFVPGLYVPRVPSRATSSVVSIYRLLYRHLACSL